MGDSYFHGIDREYGFFAFTHNILMQQLPHHHIWWQYLSNTIGIFHREFAFLHSRMPLKIFLIFFVSGANLLDSSGIGVIWQIAKNNDHGHCDAPVIIIILQISHCIYANYWTDLRQLEYF